MDPELQRLIRQLQDEKCPPAVLDRVTYRITRAKTRSRSVLVAPAWIVCAACLLGALAFWQWQSRRTSQMIVAERTAEEARAAVHAQRALVVQQTHEAFGHIGQALIRAAAHTENALLREAVPPLRTGFETAMNKIRNPI